MGRERERENMYLFVENNTIRVIDSLNDSCGLYTYSLCIHPFYRNTYLRFMLFYYLRLSVYPFGARMLSPNIIIKYHLWLYVSREEINDGKMWDAIETDTDVPLSTLNCNRHNQILYVFFECVVRCREPYNNLNHTLNDTLRIIYYSLLYYSREFHFIASPQVYVPRACIHRSDVIEPLHINGDTKCR